MALIRDRRLLFCCWTLLAFSTWVACAPKQPAGEAVSGESPPTSEAGSAPAAEVPGTESEMPGTESEMPGTESPVTEIGLICMAGDWDGDGTDEIAAVVARQAQPLTWFFPGLEPAEDRELAFGLATDQPIAGDWNGDGLDSPGVVRQGGWHLLLDRNDADSTKIFPFGVAADSPIAGDWNGDGIDTPGIVRKGDWYLVDSFDKDKADHIFIYGDTTDLPLTGDWDGDGKDSAGVERDGVVFLRNELSPGIGDIKLDYKGSDDSLIFGDWNGDGLDTPGLVRDGAVFIRDDFEQGPATRTLPCRALTDLPPVDTPVGAPPGTASSPTAAE